MAHECRDLLGTGRCPCTMAKCGVCGAKANIALLISWSLTDGGGVRIVTDRRQPEGNRTGLCDAHFSSYQTSLAEAAAQKHGPAAFFKCITDSAELKELLDRTV